MKPFEGKKFAFILPRYFAGVVGGAETLSADLATLSASLGAQVEIWTTCAKDNRSWDNAFPPGSDEQDGLLVRRFKVDDRDLEKWIPRQIQLSEGVPLSLDDQFIWMEESVNSRSLYSHIMDYGKRFDLLFFAPYLFGTTFWGALIYPERSVLIPCLHDESNAYLDLTASLFRQVLGCVFNAAPEKELAKRLYGSDLTGDVVGMTFPLLKHPKDYAPYFSESFPYLLYLGRMETGKNLDWLLDQFVAAKQQYRLSDAVKLVIAGGGSFEDLSRNNYLSREDLIVLGRVSEEEKMSLLSEALALVQPSVNESFCIVMMEGWACSTPALVHEDCAVTKDHVVRSEGGLYFSDAADFSGVVTQLLSDKALVSQMGDAGRAYVLHEYSAEAVRERLVSVVSQLINMQRPLTSEIRE